jgi:hypothetical protein
MIFSSKALTLGLVVALLVLRLGVSIHLEQLLDGLPLLGGVLQLLDVGLGGVLVLAAHEGGAGDDDPGDDGRAEQEGAEEGGNQACLSEHRFPPEIGEQGAWSEGRRAVITARPRPRWGPGALDGRCRSQV